MTNNENSTKFISEKQEKYVANFLDGYVQPGSGNGKFKKSDVVDPNEKILAPIVCIAFIFPKSDITKSRRLHNIDPIMLLYVDLNKIDSLNNPINNGYWSYGNNVVALKVHNKTYGFIITTNQSYSYTSKSYIIIYNINPL